MYMALGQYRHMLSLFVVLIAFCPFSPARKTSHSVCLPIMSQISIFVIFVPAWTTFEPGYAMQNVFGYSFAECALPNLPSCILNSM